MDTKLVQEIRQTMDAKLTNELIEIYRHHNEGEYSAEALEAVRQVLLTRGEAIPAIDPAKQCPRKVRTVNGGQLSVSAILFSFKGRIPRKTFWLTSIPLFVFDYLLGKMIEGTRGEMIIALLFVPIAVWMWLAVQVKRWHDRGKSGLGCPNRLLSVDRFLDSRGQSRLSSAWRHSIFKESVSNRVPQLRPIEFFITR